MCIPTPNTGQLNPLFHTFAEFRLIVNRIVVRQSTDWLAANAQFSPNGNRFFFVNQLTTDYVLCGACSEIDCMCVWVGKTSCRSLCKKKKCLKTKNSIIGRLRRSSGVQRFQWKMAANRRGVLGFKVSFAHTHTHIHTHTHTHAHTHTHTHMHT